jgi:hypothetical protein
MKSLNGNLFPLFLVIAPPIFDFSYITPQGIKIGCLIGETIKHKRINKKEGRSN